MAPRGLEKQMTDSLFPPMSQTQASKPRSTPAPQPRLGERSFAVRLFPLSMIVLVVALILRAVLAFPRIFPILIDGDNDDIMRLMEIRDWLGGQGWFDMMQYRILGPEGISMHWSRYVDLGISSILVPLSWIFPQTTAENLALVIWPTLLLSLMVGVVGFGTRRVIGPGAAIMAMCMTVLWLPMGTLFFGPGRIDHHNVQMLTTAVMAYALIWPGDALRRGLIAGAAAAFSLAVGLETLPLILVAGGMLLVRSGFERPAANGVLTGFCLSLVGAEVVLFLGQTPAREWMVPHCDELAPPVMALSLIASAACLLPMAARRWLPNPAARLVASAAVAGLGVAIFSPLLSPCLAGPYGALPPDVQKMIHSQITEALPGLVFASHGPKTYNNLLTPVFAVVALTALLIWARRKVAAQSVAARDVASPDVASQDSAAIQMMVLASVGLLGSFYQIRMTNLTGCAVPFLTGYVLNCLWQKRAARPNSIWSLALVAGVLVLEMPASVNVPVAALIKTSMPLASARSAETQPDFNDCRNPKDLGALDVLPSARILTSLELGAPMIATTHHTGLAAPYHRSAASMWNGVFGFTSAENMVKAIRASGAEYVAVCTTLDIARQPEFTAKLMRGEATPWLQPVPVAGTALKVYKVLPEMVAVQP